jgi:hypothetical protein
MFENIYIKNKYTKTYFRIIKRAKKRKKPDCYTEDHHNPPQCITKYLGLPESETIPLTFKEHLVCHHLLMKMVTGILKGKMWLAFHMMLQNNKNRKGRIINLKIFENIKISNLDAISGENSPLFGKKRGPYKKSNKPRKPYKKRTTSWNKGLKTGPRKPYKPRKKEIKPRKPRSPITDIDRKHKSEAQKKRRAKEKQ